MENDDKLFNSSAGGRMGWVAEPFHYDAGGGRVYVGGGDSPPHLLNRDARLNGLRGGVLYPYMDNTKAFHCPGDKRAIKGSSDATRSTNPLRYYQIYNSYGLPEFYGGGGVPISDIKNGGQAILFVEFQYDRTFNSGDWSYDPGDRSWHDPLGNYHNKSCTFAFVDGHAEHYKWRDPRTVIFMGDRHLAANGIISPGDNNPIQPGRSFGKNDQQNPPYANPDHAWMDLHYPSM